MINVKQEKIFFNYFIFCLVFLAQLSYAEEKRVRLFILADMGNEPDEVQQMAHMVISSNEFCPEGLIAVTGKYFRPESKGAYRRVTHPELFHKIIDAYGKIYGTQIHTISTIPRR